MIILGGIIVLAKFSPDLAFIMPPSFVPISIDGGEYVVPGEFERWTDIPAGVMESFKESVLDIQSRISEVFWGKVPIPNKKLKFPQAGTQKLPSELIHLSLMH